MENNKKLLKYASILNIAISVLALPVWVYSAFVFTIGIILYYLSSESDEKLLNNNLLLTILGIILFPFNFISSIMIFTVNGNISEYKAKSNQTNGPPVLVKKVINPESKKIDILLKLGVAMVFISGILFATNSWTIINNTFKSAALIIFGLLFIGLSVFSEKNLKLYRSSYIYWILGISFLLLSVIATIYFNVFGNYLNFYGNSKNLSFAIVLITLCSLLIATYLKFPKKYLLYIIYTSVLFIIYNLFKYMKLDIGLSIMLVAIISFIISVFSSEDTVVHNFGHLLSASIFSIIIKSMNSANEWLVVITSIINIANLYYISYRTKERDNYFIALIISYILIYAAIYNLNNLDGINHLIVFAIISLPVLLVKCNIINISDNDFKGTYIIYSIASLIVFMASIIQHDVIAFIISLIYLIINIFMTKKVVNTKHLDFAKYLEPMTIMITIIALVNIKSLNLNFSVYRTVLITSIIYCIYNYLTKDDAKKKIYFISTIISTIACIQTSMFLDNKLELLLALIPALYILYFGINYSKKNDNKIYTIITYLILIVLLDFILVEVNCFGIDKVIGNILLIGLLCIPILIGKEGIITKISYFAIVLPLVNLVYLLELNQEYKSIIISIFVLYVTFLIIKFVIKDENAKNIVAFIGFIISVLLAFSLESYIVGIYIGVIGFIAIILGYNYKTVGSLFVTGIVVTILNIVYQLRNFWQQLPAYLYLLLGGLSLIAFVTYKEIKKSKKK